MPFETIYCHVVIINGVVYVGGGLIICDVLEYHPGSGEWSMLPTPLVGYFAMASLNGQLVLVGVGGSGDFLFLFFIKKSSEYRRVPEVGGPNLTLPCQLRGVTQLLWATSTTS